MAQLANAMPSVAVSKLALRRWGKKWLNAASAPNTSIAKAFNRKQSMDFAKVFDTAVAKAMAAMLGGIPIKVPTSTALIPSKADCVEIGAIRIVGGIRPQNYDVAYRPDGVRFAFDSKTLNDKNSIGKNWQNMINDLATEASTAHTRFPYAVVAFMVIVPKPALMMAQGGALIRTLERMATRVHVTNETHLAEAIAFVVWNPHTGRISDFVPPAASNLHIKNFSRIVYNRYIERYQGLPPHDL